MICRIKPGDRVAYSAMFLTSIGGDYELAQARGLVTEVSQLGQTFLARIDWGSLDIPGRVNVANLAKVGSAAFGDNATRPNNVE